MTYGFYVKIKNVIIINYYRLSHDVVTWGVLLKAGPRPGGPRPTARGPRPAARGPLHGLWPSGPRPTQRPLAQRPAAHSTNQRPNFFGQRLIEVHAQLWITASASAHARWMMVSLHARFDSNPSQSL